jgi:hypothetical protein
MRVRQPNNELPSNKRFPSAPAIILSLFIGITIVIMAVTGQIKKISIGDFVIVGSENNPGLIQSSPGWLLLAIVAIVAIVLVPIAVEAFGKKISRGSFFLCISGLVLLVLLGSMFIFVQADSAPVTSSAITTPTSTPTPTPTLTPTPTSTSNGYTFIDEKRTEPYLTVQFTEVLAEDEIIFGHGVNFFALGKQNVSCALFIVKGGATKTFTVKDGIWFKFKGKATEQQYEEQKETIKAGMHPGCKPVNTVEY